jgi:HEAT repeat protein
LWNEHQSLIQGESRDHLVDFASRAGLGRAARRMLRHGRMQNRLIAITALGNLRDRSAWHELRPLAESPNPYVSLAAAKAMMRIDAAAAGPTVVHALARRVEWSPARVAAMLRAVGAEAFSATLAAEAATPRSRSSPRFIRLLELCHPQDALPATRHIIDDAVDEETICACLHVLGHFRDPEDLERVRAHLDHGASNVRIRAVTVMGLIAGLEDWPAIARMLADSEWWVRYRAAQALGGLPGMTPERLRELRDQQTDRFARDILDQVMAEAALR